MTLELWWESEPKERYWMEVATDHGGPLMAPRENRQIQTVRRGDVVFHYQTPLRPEPAIIGISRATGELSKHPRRDWYWESGIEEYRPLSQPITLSKLRKYELSIEEKWERLKSVKKGPYFFPFTFPEGQSMSILQGQYLLKLPKSILETVTELREALHSFAKAR